ncbi:MAG: UDP-glucuronic acid decarboxylase family protein [bacterium]|nr:UDP-glucuronic acid decarboxylase family protein [bacterium]
MVNRSTSKDRRPRSLITGGAGFIGSHLVSFLLEKGHEVICLDNLLTGSLSNFKPLDPKAPFQFIEHDVTNYIDVDGPLDYVLHFASPASPLDYQRFPIQTLKVGALGTHRVLGVAKAKGTVFLLASTSEVYGDPLVHPQHEDYWGNVNPLGPRGVYDEAKRFAEAITTAYHRTHGIDTKIARIFNTYGPRMRLEDGRAVPTFIGQALRGESITVFGDGTQTRSFCYIDDLVEGIWRLLVSDYNGPVNLGNPQEISILELAAMVKRQSGSSSPVVHKPLPVDDPKIRRPNITRATTILRWKPNVDIEEGLKRTISYYQDELGSHDT